MKHASSKYASWFLLLVTACQKRRLHSKGQGFTKRSPKQLSVLIHACRNSCCSFSLPSCGDDRVQAVWAWVSLSVCFRLVSCSLHCLNLRSAAIISSSDEIVRIKIIPWELIPSLMWNLHIHNRDARIRQHVICGVQTAKAVCSAVLTWMGKDFQPDSFFPSKNQATYTFVVGLHEFTQNPVQFFS